MARAVIIAGGNLGDVNITIDRAKDEIQRLVGEIVECSTKLQSDAWGFNSTNRFVNQVIVVETLLSPEQLLDQLEDIECSLGREKIRGIASYGLERKYISRCIDLDILFYDDLVVDTPCLKIPQPLMELREFVLVPLCQIMPDMVHPITGKTIKQMLNEVSSR